MSLIHFQILPPIHRPEDPVAITGNCPALGDWDPGRALALEWRPPYHVGTVEVERGTHLEYKILRGGWETEAVDAFGNVPPNLAHDVWLGETVRHTVADWKDRYAGRLTREWLHSHALADGRDLLIWLPPAYAAEPGRRFPLLVMHDGDNVFNPATSPLTGVDWAADEWVWHLAREGVAPEMIIVAVRHPEGYASEGETLRDFDLSPELGGSAYATFVARELVAHMDTHYRTLPDARSRILAGSSLGGLNSFYTALRHPGVFGTFLCFSTAFEDVSESLPGESGQLLALESAPSIDPGTRFFFDYGTRGLDECYEPYHRDLAALLRAKGLIESGSFIVRRIIGGSHDELSWRERFGDGLRFACARSA